MRLCSLCVCLLAAWSWLRRRARVMRPCFCFLLDSQLETCTPLAMDWGAPAGWSAVLCNALVGRGTVSMCMLLQERRCSV